jgi:DNA-binding transcriptional ArsR family regulator
MPATTPRVSSPTAEPEVDPAAPPGLPGDGRPLERAARIFRALGDPERLRLMLILVDGERSVTHLAQAVGDRDLSTISNRLRVLRTDDLVARRRAGKRVFYRLADQHVFDLVANALAHAEERRRPR